jgi:hypothetical protein
MKGNEIEVGKVYAVKVSGKVVPVRIWRKCERFPKHRPYGVDYWEGCNCRTGRQVKILSAQRFRYEWEGPLR